MQRFYGPSIILGVLLIQTSYGNSQINDIPPASIDNLRWHLESDRWIWKDEFILKGKVYVVPSEKDSSMVKIYQDKKLEGDPILTLTDQYGLYQKGQKICDIGTKEKGMVPKKYYHCQSYYCFIEENERKAPILNLRSLHVESLSHNQKACPYKVDVVTVTSGSRDLPYPDENSFYNVFKFVSIDPEHNSLEVLVNGKSAYVDIRHCKKLKTNVKCGALDIKFSKYELGWIDLKKVQQEKKHKKLNEALDLVLPCVKKRDVACVQEYFMTPDKLESPDDYFVKTEFNEDTFTELEACLRYESLLIHQKALKGIKKACIFDFDTTGIIFKNVAYPEAIGVADRLIEE